MTIRSTKKCAKNLAQPQAKWTILEGDCEAVLKTLPSNSIDSVVTDAPYGMSQAANDPQQVAMIMQAWLNGNTPKISGCGYAGAEWDVLPPSPSIWREVFRVLKPGGYAAVFASSRTDDLTKLALRLAGFEINDTICFILKGGFPKYQDVGRALEKRLRKWGHHPDESHHEGRSTFRNLRGNAFKKSLMRQNTLKQIVAEVVEPSHDLSRKWMGYHTHLKSSHQPIVVAKKPVWSNVLDNVIRYGVGALNTDACAIPLPKNDNRLVSNLNSNASQKGRYPANVVGDLGSENEKYFVNATYYIGKRTMPKDRDEYMPAGEINTHPTCKTLDLMDWLTKLVTPTGGKILDPFAGSGSTGISAIRQGFEFVGIELDSTYASIAKKRLEVCEERHVKIKDAA
jgi:site-specific DNA-methyltransferase (adenine-specific)